MITEGVGGRRRGAASGASLQAGEARSQSSKSRFSKNTEVGVEVAEKVGATRCKDYLQC